MCRSPAMMRGYWRDPELTAEVVDAGGWLHTGDLGFLDGDANLRLVGRLKEMYIRGGYNVYPVEVEGVLAEHPAVGRVAIVGIPDPVLGEIGVAFVVPAPAGASELAGGAGPRRAPGVVPGPPRRLQGARPRRGGRRPSAQPHAQGRQGRPGRHAHGEG